MQTIPSAEPSTSRPTRRQFIDKLCCPLCHSPLSLQSVTSGEEIWEGTLQCAPCARTFPIHKGIPDLLVECDVSRTADSPFPQHLVSPVHIAALAAETKADSLQLDKAIDPHEFFHVRHRKLLILLRVLVWTCLLSSWVPGKSAMILAAVASTGFLADFLIMRLLRKYEYRWEIAQLLQFAKQGQLHEKDGENAGEGQEVDTEAAPEDRSLDIREAVQDVDLKGKDVLHIGCGTEKDSDINDVYLRNKARLTGLDVAVPSLMAFKKIFSTEGVRAEAMSLPFQTGTFDFTNCTDIIEHVHDPYRFLQENFRVLKPGGHMLLITPNRSRARQNMDILNPLILLQYILGSYFSALLPPPERTGRHLNFVFFHTSFTTGEIRELVEAAGFEILFVSVKAYRGHMKRVRRWVARIPFINLINDSVFALVRKPAQSGPNAGSPPPFSRC